MISHEHQDRIIRIEDKIDELKTSVGELSTLMAIHIEKAKHVEQELAHVVTDLAPIKKHVAMVTGVAKLLTLLGTLGGGLLLFKK